MDQQELMAAKTFVDNTKADLGGTNISEPLEYVLQTYKVMQILYFFVLIFLYFVYLIFVCINMLAGHQATKSDICVDRWSSGESGDSHRDGYEAERLASLHRWNWNGCRVCESECEYRGRGRLSREKVSRARGRQRELNAKFIPVAS